MNKDYVTRNELNTQMAKVERTEVIYDMNSDDININLGFPDGFYNNTITKDVSKYKYLKFYVDNCTIVSCRVGGLARQLTQTYNLGSTGSRFVYGVRIHVTPTDFTFTSFNSQGTGDVDGIDWISVTKVEGVY